MYFFYSKMDLFMKRKVLGTTLTVEEQRKARLNKNNAETKNTHKKTEQQ